MKESIAAVVLAAGRSLRMGGPKLLLPWGNTTVIGRVVQMLEEAGVTQILVVMGRAREQVEQALAGHSISAAYNPNFEQEEMLSSAQIGLRSLPPEAGAALIVLGDQPQIEPEVVRAVLAAYARSGASLVVPSYQMHRGHPWLVGRSLWQAILDLPPESTLRDFLRQHAGLIEYVTVQTPSVLGDLDTPEDYERQKPT